MSGHVGVIANDTGRYSLFTFMLTMLQVPVNTKIQPALTSDRILGRNKLAKMAVEEGAEWLLFIDDDHAFRPDLLKNLLQHDVPIVGSLYLQRMLPFAPVAYSHKESASSLPNGSTRSDNGNDAKPGDYYIPIDLTSLPDTGLVEVCAVGTGGMLVRTEVFRELEYPYFEHGRASEDLSSATAPAMRDSRSFAIWDHVLGTSLSLQFGPLGSMKNGLSVSRWLTTSRCTCPSRVLPRSKWPRPTL